MEELQYVKWSNNKIKINPNDYKIIDEDKTPYKKIPYQKLDIMIDDNLEDVKPYSGKNVNVNIYDPYNLPDKIEVKRPNVTFDEKLFDEFIIGFHDTRSINELNKRPTSYYIFNQPTNKDIMISNLKTEGGTSNDLNNRIIENQTGESLVDIKAANETIDDIYKSEVNNILNQIDLEKKSLKNLIADNKKNAKQGDIENVNKTKILESKLNETIENEKENKTKVLDNLNERKIKHKANIKPIIEAIDKSKKFNKSKDLVKYELGNQIDRIVEKTLKDNRDNKIKKNKEEQDKRKMKDIIDDVLNKVDEEVKKKEKPTKDKSKESNVDDRLKNEAKKYNFRKNKKVQIQNEAASTITKAIKNYKDNKRDSKKDNLNLFDLFPDKGKKEFSNTGMVTRSKSKVGRPTTEETTGKTPEEILEEKRQNNNEAKKKSNNKKKIEAKKET